MVGGRRHEGVDGPGAQRADDADVAEEDSDEGQETREGEADPRPHVVLVVGVRRRHHTRVYVVVSWGDCVQSVCVLQQGSDHESRGDHVRLPRSLERAHGETHAHEALDGEGDQDPDGGRRKARLQEPDETTRHGARVGDGEVPGVAEVPVDEAERQHEGVSRGEQPQVDAGRRLAVAAASQDEKNECVPAHANDEYKRPHVAPQSCAHVDAVRSVRCLVHIQPSSC